MTQAVVGSKIDQCFRFIRYVNINYLYTEDGRVSQIGGILPRPFHYHETKLNNFNKFFDFHDYYILKVNAEADRGAGAQGVTVKPIGCGFDPYSRR